MPGPLGNLRWLVTSLRPTLDSSRRPAHPGKRLVLQVEQLERREALSTTTTLPLAQATVTPSLGDQATALVSQVTTTRAGVLVQFPNGEVRYSPENTHLGGGGQSQQVYNGAAGRATLTPLSGGGVLAQFARSQKVYFSPDYKNLAGGGQTQVAYDGSNGPVRLLAARGGAVLVQLQRTGAVFYSPDGKNLTGGGATLRMYDGAAGPLRLVALRGGGVLAQQERSGAVTYSPDFKNLTGGGQSVAAYDGRQGKLILVGTHNGGMLAQLERTNAVFLSPDNKNLAGGGQTQQVYSGRSGRATLTALRGGGVLAQFARSARVYFSPDGTNLAGGGRTALVYNGLGGPLRLVSAGAAGVLVQQTRTNAVFLSPDFKNLTGGGQTQQVYDGAGGPLRQVPQRTGGVMATQTRSGAIFYSPDYKNLAGGGQTQRVYDGRTGALTVVPVAPVQAAPENVVTTASGLKYVDQRVGTGATAANGNQLQVHYTGWLRDGTRFESSRDRGQPFPFTLGAGRVIKGWDEGIVGMKVGGVRKLIIPANLAYGEQGSPPNIPPNAELTFEVELVAITGSQTASNQTTQQAQDQTTTPPTITTASGLKYIDERVGTGATAANGNQLRVHYTGYLANGTKFESSRDTSTPFNFTLGIGQVIKGWDEGIVGMKVGGIRKLIIPANLAYGATGSPPKIPANADLTFDVELLSITG